jgi:hypothetical protein
VGPLVVAAALALGTGGRVALAQSPGQVPVHLTEDEDGGSWRRPAMWSAIGLTGVGLLSAVYFRTRYNRHVNDFNRFQAPGAQVWDQRQCAVGLPNSGPTGCAHILAGANSAKNLAKVSLGIAAGAALTALILKVTEPERSTAGAGSRNRRSAQWAVACNPLGVVGVSCGMVF